MKKIAKIITTCDHCEHCKLLKSATNNHTTAFVCAYTSESDIEHHSPFLVNYSESPGSFKLDIPDNCPLEDYKPLEP